MTKTSDLLTQLETSKGPDRALDALIYVGLKINSHTYLAISSLPGAVVMESQPDTFMYVPDYTNNMSCARELVEKVFPEALYSSGRGPNFSKRKRKSDNTKLPFDGYVASNDRIGSENFYSGLGEGPNEALALLVALFKALVQKEKSNGAVAV